MTLSSRHAVLVLLGQKIPMIARDTNTTASASENETDKVISFIDYKDESQLEHVDKLVACDRK